MWIVTVFVATFVRLTCVVPCYSQSVLAEQSFDPKPANELYGFDEARPRQFFHRNIKTSLQSYYQYLAISYCFSRHYVALPGFEGYFRSVSEMERQNADKLVAYLMKRGMTYDFASISVNDKFIQCYERDDSDVTAWSYVMKVVDFLLADQKDRLDKFKKTHTAAVLNNFPHLKHFIEDGFLDQKYLKIKEVAEMKTQLERIRANENSELGLFTFDRSLA